MVKICYKNTALIKRGILIRPVTIRAAFYLKNMLQHVFLIVNTTGMYIERLRNLKKDNDLSQEKIAELLNCKQQAYSNYEKGKRTIPYEMLIL